MRSNDLAALATNIGHFIELSGHNKKDWHRLNIVVRALEEGVAVYEITLTVFKGSKEIVVEQLIPIRRTVEQTHDDNQMD